VTCEEYKKCIMCVEYLRTIDILRAERDLMQAQITVYQADIERLHRDNDTRQEIIDKLEGYHGY
jgi:hypothetical protein